MNKRKKIITMLSTLAITGLIAIGGSTSVSAKATGVVIKGNDGKLYQYNYQALRDSAKEAAVGDKVGGSLYNDFKTRQPMIQAYYDDVRKVYVSVEEIYLKFNETINPTNLDKIMEDETTRTIILDPTKVTVDSNGSVTLD